LSISHECDAGRAFALPHRIHAKWTITERNQRIPGFIYEEQCLTFLRELQAQWAGRFDERPFTPVEQAAFEEITSQTFRSRTDGQEAGDCLFQPDFTFNWAGRLFCWQIEEDKDGDVVVIITLPNKRRLCFLRKTPQGSWEGHWRFWDRPLIELWPQSQKSHLDRVSTGSGSDLVKP